jgi:hypothetical protein
VTGGGDQEGQPRQKVSKTPSQQISQAWWYTPPIPAMLEAQVGGLQSKAKHKLQDPIQKNQKTRLSALLKW